MNNMTESAKGFLAGCLLILCVWGAYSIGAQRAETTTNPAPATSTSVAVLEAPKDAPVAETRTAFSDLPTMLPAELPPEAIDTIDLILSGGPYPFSKDDSVFQNREGYLPDFPRGHYREYTVITPGADNRGARRIVAGENGEIYYTSDHYNSFHEVLL